MRFQRGKTTLGELRKMMAQRRSGGSEYGLGPVTPDPAKRRSTGQPGGKKAPPKAKTGAPKKMSAESDAMRAEWFVNAERGTTKLQLPAPDGEEQANAMRDNLIATGWQAEAVVRSTHAKDPRFHEIQRET